MDKEDRDKNFERQKIRNVPFIREHSDKESDQYCSLKFYNPCTSKFNYQQ